MKRAALLGLFIPFLTCAQAQTTPDALKASVDKLKAAPSITGTMQVTFPLAKPQTWKFKLLKPNLYVVTAPDQEFRFDGKTEYLYLPESKQYNVVDRSGMAINSAPFLFGLDAFFAAGQTIASTHSEAAKVDNANVVAYTVQQPGFANPTILYIDPATSLPTGYVQAIDNQDRIVVRYSSFKVGDPLKPEDFAWSPPKGTAPIESHDYESTLLKAETIAPDAKLQSTNGTPLQLTTVFPNHKATLLYFWNATPPIPDLGPLLNLDKQYREQGLRIITVNYSSDREKAMSYLKSTDTPFQNVWDQNGLAAKSYGIQVPSVYLINHEGRVVSHSVGFDPGALSRGLRNIGFQVH